MDKLAYLEDDSAFTGVAYGRGVDVTRLVAAATVVQVPGTRPGKTAWHIGFKEEALSAVESLVMARYWMFRTVYWHRVNRALMTMMLYVIRKLYVEGKANASEYVVDTMWKSEEAVLEYLNDKFKARFGADSITHMVLRDKSRIYQRLVSVQGTSIDRKEGSLYESLADLDGPKLSTYLENLRGRVEQFVRHLSGGGVSVLEEDVLLDIPGRRLDISGDIFIETENGFVVPIQNIPGPVQRIFTEFERLAKRLRVFVHPRIAHLIGKETLIVCSFIDFWTKGER